MPWLSLTDRTSYIKAPTGVWCRGMMANDCIRGLIIMIFLFWPGIKPKLAACFHWITAQNTGSLGYNPRQCIVLYWQSGAYLIFLHGKRIAPTEMLHYTDILPTQNLALYWDIAQTETLHYIDSLQNVVHQREHVAKTAPCIILTIIGRSLSLFLNRELNCPWGNFLVWESKVLPDAQCKPYLLQRRKPPPLLQCPRDRATHTSATVTVESTHTQSSTIRTKHTLYPFLLFFLPFFLSCHAHQCWAFIPKNRNKVRVRAGVGKRYRKKVRVGVRVSRRSRKMVRVGVSKRHRRYTKKVKVGVSVSRRYRKKVRVQVRGTER